MFADDSFVPPHVSEGARGSPLTRGAHVELAHGGSALVHAGEGEGLGPELLGQGHLDVEGDVLHGGHQQLHGRYLDLELEAFLVRESSYNLVVIKVQFYIDIVYGNITVLIHV